MPPGLKFLRDVIFIDTPGFTSAHGEKKSNYYPLFVDLIMRYEIKPKKSKRLIFLTEKPMTDALMAFFSCFVTRSDKIFYLMTKSNDQMDEINRLFLRVLRPFTEKVTWIATKVGVEYGISDGVASIVSTMRALDAAKRKVCCLVFGHIIFCFLFCFLD